MKILKKSLIAAAALATCASMTTFAEDGSNTVVVPDTVAVTHLNENTTINLTTSDINDARDSSTDFTASLVTKLCIYSNSTNGAAAVTVSAPPTYNNSGAFALLDGETPANATNYIMTVGGQTFTPGQTRDLDVGETNANSGGCTTGVTATLTIPANTVKNMTAGNYTVAYSITAAPTA